MNSQTRQLIQLISENKTLNEISNILGLSNQQIIKRLSLIENSGYLFERDYHYNGEISYHLKNPFYQIQKPNEIHINLPKTEKKIRAVLISDTHKGHIDDANKCHDAVYEYCKKNGIHIIFHGGDLYQGFVSGQKQCNKFTAPEKQIEYGIKTFPYDKNILNITVLGNHDASLWLEYGIDIRQILLNRRHDIIPVGYEYGKILIGNYLFELIHKIEKLPYHIKPKPNKNSIRMNGHSHRFKIVTLNNNNSLIINVPSLSYTKEVNTSYPDIEISTLPSMIDMELTISYNSIVSEYFQHFIFFNDQPIRVGEFQANANIRQRPRQNIPTLTSNIQEQIMKTLNLEQETTNQNQFNEQSDKQELDEQKLNEFNKTKKLRKIYEIPKVKMIEKNIRC